MKRDPKKYRDGIRDGMTPRQPVDLSLVKDTDELLRHMSQAAFAGKKVGQAVDALVQMITDKDAFVVMTLSGAMTPAGMGLLVCEMVDRGFVHAIVSTGALMTHGLVESSGRSHFHVDPKMSDAELFAKGYNRIFDVVELEKNLDDIEAIIYQILGNLDPKTTLSSRKITHLLGEWLSKNAQGRGILRSTFANNVPVYIPAFTDSELGLDVALYNRRQVAQKEDPLNYNPFFDLEHYAELINQQKTLGIFTIGGGVPRNWAQEIGPYLELIKSRMPKGMAPEHIQGQPFKYGLRICPESVKWGGLSGCTYTEGVSWGKFLPKELGGIHTEVLEDATVVWPMILLATIQRLEKMGIKKAEKNFSLADQLEETARLTKQYRLER
ncbi:MAG: deoxyhypusine synthase family protein [Candidatus Pacebacteria bacterium]|nr:deoxyhypusine synthase family protein [Candidatus Paceibacterota bacterium]